MDLAIIKELMTCASAEQRTVLMRFFKTGKGQYGYGDDFLGVKVPETRAVVKKYWARCDRQDVERLVGSRYHEIRLAGLLVLVAKFHFGMKHDPALADETARFYLAHTDAINSWDLVDLSCYEILGNWVLMGRAPKGLLDKLASSKNLWEQRIAIVSTMQLIRHGEFETTLRLADRLLTHEHDLIHKAVGWLLREVGKRDRARLEEYLGPRYREMPRTMLRYAIEKFPEELRRQYLAGRIIVKSPRLQSFRCPGGETGDEPYCAKE